MTEFRTRIILRNDSTSGWSTAVADAGDNGLVLLKGEMGIEFTANGKAKVKIGDGTTSWQNLPYFGGEEAHVYEAQVAKGGNHMDALATAVNGAELNKHDVAIVKEAVVAADKLTDTVEQKYQYTAYRYNGDAWVAMDGNYSAENVYFDEDFTFTKAIGTVTIPSSGSKVVAAAGKNLKEFFAGLFAAEANPSKTDPSVNSFSMTGGGTVEVGTTVTPVLSASYTDGSYTYGPEPTGATVTKWKLTTTAGDSFEEETTTTSFSKTCAALLVTDGMSVNATATVTHTAGSVPKTNIGNPCTDTSKQIAAGTKTKTINAQVVGYRKSFHGSKTAAVALNSGNIRGLTGENSSNGTLSVTVVEGAKQVIIAVPSGRKVTKVADEGAFGTDIFSEFNDEVVNVEGANGYTAKAYNVYVYTPSAALGANTYTVTVANE